jgi:hypothetical protein
LKSNLNNSDLQILDLLIVKFDVSRNFLLILRLQKSEIETIKQTNYINRTGTWTLKSIGVLIIIGLLLNFDVGLDSYLLIALAIVLAIVIVIARVNDIGVDNKYFYHIRNSIIPTLTKVDKFEIEKMNSIRWKGYKSKLQRYYGRRTMQGIDYGIEISFTDDSSVSLNISMDHKDMDRILNVVKEQIKKALSPTIKL